MILLFFKSKTKKISYFMIMGLRKKTYQKKKRKMRRRTKMRKKTRGGSHYIKNSEGRWVEKSKLKKFPESPCGILFDFDIRKVKEPYNCGSNDSSGLISVNCLKEELRLFIEEYSKELRASQNWKKIRDDVFSSQGLSQIVEEMLVKVKQEREALLENLVVPKYENYINFILYLSNPQENMYDLIFGNCSKKDSIMKYYNHIKSNKIQLSDLEKILQGSFNFSIPTTKGGSKISQKGGAYEMNMNLITQGIRKKINETIKKYIKQGKKFNHTLDPAQSKLFFKYDEIIQKGLKQYFLLRYKNNNQYLYLMFQGNYVLCDFIGSLYLLKENTEIISF
jgi:hypothetical protein